MKNKINPVKYVAKRRPPKAEFNRVKKIFSLILAICLFFPFSNAQAVPVDSINTTATTGAMNDIISDLGVNKTEMKNMIQEMNVARNKKLQPQVSLNFNPQNPTPGEKVTATATPMYFLNTDKDMYFTWYLKQDGCPETSGNLSDEKKTKCDLDDDNDIDINDYKIKAARAIANNDFEWNKSGAYSEDNDGDGHSAVWGGEDQRGKNNYCYVHDTTSGDEYQITCDHHLFAEMGDNVHGSGDGSFGLSEEKFWHTNPKDPDTADTGNGDEANVIGLGVSSFSWTYAEGDEVGVAVEGVSIEPTTSADSSYRIMIALLKNKCDMNYENEYPKTTETGRTTTIDTPAPGQTTTVITSNREAIYQQSAGYAEILTTPITRTLVTDSATGETISDTSTEGTATSSFKNISSGYYPKNITKVSDFDKCLTGNLISPAEGGGTKEKMDIQLDYSPTAPMNDPTASGTDGDTLKITSSIINVSNSNYLNYTWQVYKSDQASPDDWGDPLTKSQLVNSSQTSGIGLDNFSFRLNFSDTGTFYLKVKLTVKENVSSKSVREGYNYVVIPVSSATEKIKAYGTTVSSSTTGNPMVQMGSTEMCTSGMDKSICPVVKDQIIGVKVSSGLSDFAWKINGQSFNYTTCFFEGCNASKQTNVAFFPVLDEPGNEYTVTLNATDITSGKKVSLVRYFKVIEPEVQIYSTDESTCKPVLLGHYIDYNGDEWPDYSKENFEAAAGKNVKLGASFSGFVPDSSNWTWAVDDVAINSSNAKTYGYEINSDNQLVIPEIAEGVTADVAVSARYYPDTATKKALNAYWGVNYSEFYESQFGHSIEVKSVDSLSESSASAGKGKIFASLFTSTPSYVAFLFRIVLTGGLLLFFSGFILSMFPNIKRDY